MSDSEEDLSSSSSFDPPDSRSNSTSRPSSSTSALLPHHRHAVNELSRVHVLIRVRPLDVDGLEAGSYYCVKTSSEDLHFAEIFSPEDPDETRDFTFDHVFGPAASQAEVYHKIRSTVLPVLCGYNATVMAYGQTGSGKTHSLLNMVAGDPEVSGLVPRVVQDLFSRMAKDPFHDYMVTCSFMQLYNENIHDLLRPENAFLTIREHPRHGVYVENLSEYVVRCGSDVLELMESGRQRIVYAETKMNRASSRSHAIFQVVVKRSLREEASGDLISNLSVEVDTTAENFDPTKVGQMSGSVLVGFPPCFHVVFLLLREIFVVAHRCA